MNVSAPAAASGEKKMKSIVIATANPDYTAKLGNLLRQNGFQVMTGATCGDILSLLLQGTKIDAAVVDYEIADFLVLMRALRSHTPVPPPAIVMNDRVAVSDYLTAVSAGAFDFFYWPVRPSEFLRIVGIALRQNIVPSRADAHRYEPNRTALASSRPNAGVLP